MSLLLIPIAPLFRTKSRLRDCFSKDQLKTLTISMFKDLGKTLSKVKCFDDKIVYCNDSEILEISDQYGLTGIKEYLTKPNRTFNYVIKDLNTIAIEKFDAITTVFTFLDIILISVKNFYDIHSLLQNNQILICPAINSAGISIFGRNPPEIVSSQCFSDPMTTSLISLSHEALKKGLKITFYDSFRAGFDIDIKEDLVLAYEYLKIFNLKDTETYKYLKKNLKFSLLKTSASDNRKFKLIERK